MAYSGKRKNSSPGLGKSKVHTSKILTGKVADVPTLAPPAAKGQRAAIVLEFSELVDELRREARERQLAGLKQGNESPVSPDLGKRGKVHVAKELAEKSGIGRSSMEYLMAVQRDAPDLFDKVKSVINGLSI